MIKFFCSSHIFQDTDIFLLKNSSCSRRRAHKVLKNTIPSKKGGFVALITAIIISAVLLIVSISLNRAGYLTRGEALDAEYKDRSSALAEGCVDIAMLKLAEDPSYFGNEANIPISSDNCAIGAVIQSGSTYTINTSAVFPSSGVTPQGAVTNLHVVINSTDFSAVSWLETP